MLQNVTLHCSNEMRYTGTAKKMKGTFKRHNATASVTGWLDIRILFYIVTFHFCVRNNSLIADSLISLESLLMNVTQSSNT